MSNIKSIREFICYNQKELIQYEYIVSQTHKELRHCLEDKDKDIELEALDNAIQKLIDTAYSELLKILYKNTEYINNLFESIGIKDNPRITIKTLEGGRVLDFFRAHSTASLTTSEIENNTGFKEIMSSPKVMSFLRNNLEEDFINNKYKNHRLNDDLREALAKKENGISWEDCWSPITDGGKDKFPYRSTLIIPMSIRISEQDNSTFVDKFYKTIEHANRVRTVWGFLCFDYEQENIFLNREENLKDIGYIIADVLSLYLMFFYDHISGSETVENALNKLIELG